jgi:hypothetical protein
MATHVQPRRSRKTSNGSAHAAGALQSLTEHGRQLSRGIARESAALTRRTGALLGQAVQGTRRHPFIALGAVAALGALLGGALWYRKR